MKRCNQARLTENLEQYSQIGATKNGGVTRLALSSADLAAREMLKAQFKASGLVYQTDDMGNMYGTLPGKEPTKPGIYIGSHLDTVAKGGRFDGVLGVLGGLEVIQTLLEQGIELDRSVTVVNFTNEEGARFDPAMMSSGVLTEKFTKESVLEVKDSAGVSFGEALRQSGFKGAQANRVKGGQAYLELHIEQGPYLEATNHEIGIVEGVMGMFCAEITVNGQADHAGTTPMQYRHDALATAITLITELTQALGEIDETLVYTVGRLVVEPNIHTVIPNRVTFTLEARHQKPSVIAHVKEIVTGIDSNRSGCLIRQQILWQRETVEFAEPVVLACQHASNRLDYQSLNLYSGAGHDAQYMASLMPAGMIFVPSLNGKSHCEDEETAYDECANGVNVLLNAVLELDRTDN